MQINKNFLAICLTVVASTSYATNLPPLTHNLTPIKTPYKAPALAFEDMDEELKDIQSLKGKTVIVNFWATWCPPCRREMGSMEKLYQATKDKNVTLLAVNIGEDSDTVFSFLGTVEPSPNFPILFDKNGDSMAIWKVRGLPTTFVVNPEGQVVYRAIGGREFDHPKIIKTILNLAK